MKAIEFPGYDRKYVAPDCADLPAKDTKQGLLTVWEPSPEERAALAAGACITLELAMRVPPPVRLGVVRPDVLHALGGGK